MTTMYSAVFAGVAVAAQQDFFELNVPSTGLCVIHRCLITQSTEVGDAQEEGLAIRFRKGNATSGSGGTTPTAAALENAGPAFGGSVEVNNTTKASTGTPITLHAESFNVRNGFDYRPTPEERIWLSPSSRFCVELATTPADSITFDGTLIFEFLGG